MLYSSFHSRHHLLFWNRLKLNLPEFILLGSTAFLQFYRLGVGEIQPWDESLYLIRANACTRFGAWFDQTQYVIGGLYSSTHPPLVVWMMALLRVWVGEEVFVSRIVAALASIVTVIFLYKLARKLFYRETALLLTISLGSAQTFIWYGHHAQLDAPLLALLVTTLFYTYRAITETNSKLAALAGFLFGCALMTKAYQGLYILPILLALPFVMKPAKGIRLLTIIATTACIVSLPWYIYMAVQHPDFIAVYVNLFGSMKSGTYSIHSNSHWWYYINQSLINLPLLALGIPFMSRIPQEWKNRSSVREKLYLCSILWFVGMLVLLSVLKTRMPHFEMFLLAPASLLLGFWIDDLVKNNGHNISQTVSFLLVIAALVWSSSELLRIGLRVGYLPQWPRPEIVLSCSLLFFFFLAIFLLRSVPLALQRNTLRLIQCAASLILALGFTRIYATNDEAFNDGAVITANTLISLKTVHSLTVYCDDYPHESYLPQLNYYTQGWLLGWDSTHIGYTETWSACDSLLRNGKILKTDAAILYTSWDDFYSPSENEKSLQIRMRNGLKAMYVNSLSTKKYQLYWDSK